MTDNDKQRYRIDDIRPDKLDLRDYKFAFAKNVDLSKKELPDSVSLLDYTGRVMNQGHIGSCVANATVNSLELLLEQAHKKGYIEKNKVKSFSRLFHYYVIRDYENRIGKSGSYLSDAYKVISKYGICESFIYPYDPSKENTKPPQVAYDNALKHIISRYERIPGFGKTFRSVLERLIYKNNSILALKYALHLGYPVIIAGRVYNNLISYKGKLNDKSTRYLGSLEPGVKSIGGHAMCVVGYDDNLNSFIVENSWGSSWGDNGFMLFDYEAFKKDIFDAWVPVVFDSTTLEEYIKLSTDLYIHSVNGEYKGKSGKIKVKVNSGQPITDIVVYDENGDEVDDFKISIQYSKGLDRKLLKKRTYIHDKKIIIYELQDNVDSYAEDILLTCFRTDPTTSVQQIGSKMISVYVNRDHTPRPIDPPTPDPEPPKPEPKPQPPKPEPTNDDKSSNNKSLFIAGAIILAGIIYYLTTQS